MPFKIQRVPRLLNNLLSITGGLTPVELEDRVRGTIDLLQAYGSPLRQLWQNSGVVAEGAPVNILPADIPKVPYLLFGASLSVTQTATMTALSNSIWLGVPPAGYAVASQEYTQFGLTVTGAKKLSWYAPYPILLPPNILPFATMDILGTDASATVGLSVDVAILG